MINFSNQLKYFKSDWIFYDNLIHITLLIKLFNFNINGLSILINFVNHHYLLLNYQN
jgi:hypothetical protein